jgi:hypothetical protein
VLEQKTQLKAERDADREARLKEREARLKEREYEIERSHLDEQRLIEKREYDKQCAQLNEQRLAEEREHEKDKAEQAQRTLQLQIELAQTNLRATEISANKPTVLAEHVNVPKQCKPFSIGKFDEKVDSMDAYIVRFERYAINAKWDKNVWAMSLGALLTGKGLSVLQSMTPEETQDYDTLKAGLLKCYDFTEEVFRNKFRNSKPNPNETATQYLSRIGLSLARWLELAQVDSTYNGLIDFIIMDQFLHSCPREMGLYIKEHKPTKSKDLGLLADRYVDAHGSWFAYNKSKSQPSSNNRPM